ncbi:MAG TPA: LysE family transporter [Dongiaceae bacterium]|nr:LysE family transporter [Dongiaceae bacterium]
MPASQIATLATIAASFLAAALVPGPSSVSVMRTSLSNGAKAGLATAVGVAASNSLYAAAAAFGLVALLQASGAAFAIVKIVGGLYLLHLGLRMAINRNRPSVQPGAVQEMPVGRALLRGAVIDLSNPKTIMAFLGIFAVAFPAHPSFLLSVLAVAIVGTISMSWHCLLAYLFARPGLRQLYHRAGRWIDRVAGAVISSFGAALAASSL